MDADVIVIGSGMGGLTAGTLLAAEGHRVLILEAAHVPGGCSSSFKKRGGVFESGATTLIGLDEHQPLWYLQNKLGIEFPAVPIEPSMRVDMAWMVAEGEQRGEHISGGSSGPDLSLTRHRDLASWIREVSRVFGQPAEQERFWRRAKQVSDVVWRVSLKNTFFPPTSWRDALHLLRNDPRDVWILPYALRSVKEVAVSMGISHPDFFRFLDEQLMITAQAGSEQTPFLFGAPALTYTNSTNYYVPGGLIELVRSLQDVLERHDGRLQVREKVVGVERTAGGLFTVSTQKATSAHEYVAPIVISNIPVWNMAEIAGESMTEWFRAESERYSHAWGALTFGLVTRDTFPEDLPLHHQIHIPPDLAIPGAESGSVFVSMSAPGDEKRAKPGFRTLNVSTHAEPGFWFGLRGEDGSLERYDQYKREAEQAMLTLLERRLPGFSVEQVETFFSATPITWKRWVHRAMGRVGGIPQSMGRSILDWTPASTPFKGLYLCGDTVYPGQGIPGVTLSGINVYSRVLRDGKNIPGGANGTIR